MMRSRFNADQGRTEVDLNLFTTPMLDMAFQLLSFFIIFYKPGLLVEGYVYGKLLPPKELAIQDATKQKKEVDPQEKQDIPPDDVKDKIIVEIKAVAPGQQENDRGPGELSQIILHVGAVDREPIADSSISVERGLEKLRKRLEKIRAGPAGDSTTVQLQPDGNLKYREVVRVWNACRRAGFPAVGMGAPGGS